MGLIYTILFIFFIFVIIWICYLIELFYFEPIKSEYLDDTIQGNNYENNMKDELQESDVQQTKN